MHQLMSAGRWKQIRGRMQRAWGRLTRDPVGEFCGERDIMEGKLAEYQASRTRDFDRPRQPELLKEWHIVGSAPAPRGA